MNEKTDWANIQCPFALSSKEFRRNPYEYLSEIQSASQAAVIEANGFRMWLVPRYDDARRILKDSSLLKDVVEHRKRLAIQCVLRPDARARVPHASRRSLLDRDGADHRRLRSLLRGVFSYSMVEQQRPNAKRIATDLLNTLPLGKPVDLVAGFSRPFCMNLIAGIYGVPIAEAMEFPNWENAMLTGTSTEEIEEGGRQCYEFALRMIELKRRDPGDDLFTRLMEAHNRGELNVDELASTFIVLMVGAGESSNAICSGLLLMLSHPEAMAAAKGDPDTLAGYVDEVLRLESPFRLLPPRFSDAPVELGEVTIPAGEMIAVCPAAANRDPTHFQNADRFEPSATSGDHLAFGDGEHKCLGSLLARMEIGVAIQTFIDRHPTARLNATTEPPRWRPGDFMRRLDRLVITLSQ